uniref:Uncharacterized protein n=1 Tax=Cannabis sativa TaxID=3483 RepID=A0A803R3Q2_CANSA
MNFFFKKKWRRSLNYTCSSIDGHGRRRWNIEQYPWSMKMEPVLAFVVDRWVLVVGEEGYFTFSLF